MTFRNPLVIYHDSCTDGFAAAAVAFKYFAETATYEPAMYGRPLKNDWAGRDVFFLDFCPPLEVLTLRLSERPRSVIILDHHKTAKEQLEHVMIDGSTRVDQWLGELEDSCWGPDPRVAAVFDMDRSGAGLAWDFFFPYRPRPNILNRVEDRDLWRFKYDDSKAVHLALQLEPWTLRHWALEFLIPPSNFDHAMFGLIKDGQLLEKAHNAAVANVVGATLQWMTIGGHRMPVCNTPHTMASDAGNLLCRTHKCAAATYFDDAVGRRFSLRSLDEYQDVGAIAAALKASGVAAEGGGHRNAAGFVVPHGWRGE